MSFEQGFKLFLGKEIILKIKIFSVIYIYIQPNFLQKKEWTTLNLVNKQPKVLKEISQDIVTNLNLKNYFLQEIRKIMNYIKTKNEFARCINFARCYER